MFTLLVSPQLLLTPELGAGAVRRVRCAKKVENHATTRRISRFLFGELIYARDFGWDDVEVPLTPLSKSSRSSSRSSSKRSFFMWSSVFSISTMWSWLALVCDCWSVTLSLIWRTVSLRPSISCCMLVIWLKIHIWKHREMFIFPR